MGWVIAWGLANAVLYASLLPLWEGFDEPFHYGYVQEVALHCRLPKVGETQVPEEIAAALHVAPGSEAVKRNLPWIMTYRTYAGLSAAQRHELRGQLDQLHEGTTDSEILNYEAQQAPLAYAVLAVFDRAWGAVSLPERVWRLRLVCGISSGLLTASFLYLLARRLGIPPELRRGLVLVVLSSQMFYATTAHVANDWLAVPLMVLAFERMMAIKQEPNFKNGCWLGLTVSPGY